MIQLSVVIITYNEERNIGRCLDSVKEIADEILIVDSFSTDKTLDICKSYGAKIIQHSFEGHIQQKNYALSKTAFSHVLSLDADEAISDPLKTSILAIKSDWQGDGYDVNRLTNYCGVWIRHGGWYPDWKLLLFDKQKGKWTGLNPHDRYEFDEKTPRIRRISGDILHYSYYSISDHLRQVDYFTDISATTLFHKNRKASLIRLLVSPPFRLFRDYILKSGWLDGYYGFVICLISSYAVFIKYAKLRELYRRK